MKSFALISTSFLAGMVLGILLESPNGEFIKCTECQGSGRVYYDKDHPITDLGFEPGDYPCPICGAKGVLSID